MLISSVCGAASLIFHWGDTKKHLDYITTLVKMLLMAGIDSDGYL